MSANAEQDNDTTLLTSFREPKRVITITKAAWYKEAAGVVTVFSWLVFLGMIVYYAILGETPDLPTVVVLVATGSLSGMLRMTSGRISTNKYDL
jgi:hypothetical protein